MEYMEKARAMIYGRRSVRRYESTIDMDDLRSVVDAGIKGAASIPGCVKPTVQLMDGTDAESIFTGVMGHYGKVMAPAYLVVSARPEGPFFTQTGYVVEQLVLWLASQGYGTCWIGIPLNTREVLARCPLPPQEQYVILMAVGKPVGDTPLLRNVEAYKRKPLQEMVSGDIPAEWEPILEAARIAPSASNGQPWRFVCGRDGIDVYCVRQGPVKKMFYDHLNRIDCGIALAHLHLAAVGAGYASAVETGSQGPAAIFEKRKKVGNLTRIARLRIEIKA